jgi:hypothetical protein
MNDAIRLRDCQGNKNDGLIAEPIRWRNNILPLFPDSNFQFLTFTNFKNKVCAQLRQAAVQSQPL